MRLLPLGVVIYAAMYWRYDGESPGTTRLINDIAFLIGITVIVSTALLSLALLGYGIYEGFKKLTNKGVGEDNGD